MAPRIGFTLEALTRMHPGACATDARFVWKKDDAWNVGIIQPSVPREDWGRFFIQELQFCSTREARLLAAQIVAWADERDQANEPDPHEVVL